MWKDFRLMGGPVAWMVMAIVLAAALGAILAVFVADGRIADGLRAAATAGERVLLRDELDLIAQRRMATAAVVAVVLSALSAVMLAGTVWFTLLAARHSQKSAEIAQAALDEARATSRRELVPYLAIELSFPTALNLDEPVFEGDTFPVRIEIINLGQTPCYVSTAQLSVLGGESFFPEFIVRKTIQSQGRHYFSLAHFSEDDVEKLLNYRLMFTVSLKISSTFESRTIKFFFNVTAYQSMDRYGMPVDRELRLDFEPLEAENPLRAQGNPAGIDTKRADSDDQQTTNP